MTTHAMTRRPRPRPQPNRAAGPALTPTRRPGLLAAIERALQRAGLGSLLL